MPFQSIAQSEAVDETVIAHALVDHLRLDVEIRVRGKQRVVNHITRFRVMYAVVHMGSNSGPRAEQSEELFPNTGLAADSATAVAATARL